MYAFQEGKVKRVDRASVCNFVISSLRGSFKSDHAQLHVPLKHQLVGGLRKKDRIRHFHKGFYRLLDLCACLDVYHETLSKDVFKVWRIKALIFFSPS